MKKIFMKMKPLVKNYWIFLVLLSTIILLATVSFILKRAPISSPTASSWRGVRPGETTESELKTKLGDPKNEYQLEEEKIFEYSSDYKFYPNQIHTEKGKVALIKEQITYERDLNLKSFIKDYGDPSLIMYEKDLGNSYPLNIFLDKGVLVAAHISDGSVIEIWYFQPVTKEEFMTTIGKGLFSQPFQKF
jgi:hypothetical protein